MKAHLKPARETGPSGRTVAVIGTWDPLTPAHRSLFLRLCRQAHRKTSSSLAILLHPSPARFLQPQAAIWPEYGCLEARIDRLHECGLDAVLVVRFSRHDLEASSASFFDLVGGYTTLTELWLGASQSLGRCEQGSPKAIAALAHRRQIVLQFLPVSRKALAGGRMRQLLGAGRVREVVAEVGFPPVWRRPPSGVIRLSWPPGRYLAVPLTNPRACAMPNDETLEVELTPGKSLPSRLEWPRHNPSWLAIVAGPADAPI